MCNVPWANVKTKSTKWRTSTMLTRKNHCHKFHLQTSFNMRNSITCLLVLLKWMECPMVLIKEYALLIKRLMLWVFFMKIRVFLKLKRFLHPLWCNFLHLEMKLYLQVDTLRIRHANCLLLKVNIVESWKRKRWKWMLDLTHYCWWYQRIFYYCEGD
jgi:hypothetical protein